MSALKDLFTRAANHQPLTPAARALLKLITHFLLFQVLPGSLMALQGIPALTNNGSVNWGQILQAEVSAAVLAITTAAWKYFQAHKDSPLGIGLGVFSSMAQQLSQGGIGGFLQMVKEPDKSNLYLLFMQALAKMQVGGGTAPLPVVTAPPPAISAPAMPTPAPSTPSPAPILAGAREDYAG